MKINEPRPHGRPDKPGTVPTTVRLKPENYEKLRRMAFERRMSYGQIIDEWVEAESEMEGQ